MSHFKQYQSQSKNPDDRSLGDEWLDWDGQSESPVKAGKTVFMVIFAVIFVLFDLAAVLLVYMVSPRLAMWHVRFPLVACILAGILILITGLWVVQLYLTVYFERNFFLFRFRAYQIFDLVFNFVVKLAQIFHVSRDRIGHSFIKVSNTISRALKVPRKEEKLLLLLPRCLSKENLQEIRKLQECYPVEIHVVSGGELARKKVKELRPTAVIGVACERDLVSGIRDVGYKLSVIGITNVRPEGPCKNTYVDIGELREAIEFYVGDPESSQRKSDDQQS